MVRRVPKGKQEEIDSGKVVAPVLWYEYFDSENILPVTSSGTFAVFVECQTHRTATAVLNVWNCGTDFAVLANKHVIWASRIEDLIAQNGRKTSFSAREMAAAQRDLCTHPGLHKIHWPINTSFDSFPMGVN